MIMIKRDVSFFKIILHVQVRCAVILLEIVMVSPGTYLVKNHEYQSRTNESQLKKNESEIGNALVTRQLI